MLNQAIPFSHLIIFLKDILNYYYYFFYKLQLQRNSARNATPDP